VDAFVEVSVFAANRFVSAELIVAPVKLPFVEIAGAFVFLAAGIGG
jgi:hypothetical protein